MAGRRQGKWLQRSEQEWGQLLSRFGASGLGVEAFCRREAISAASFYRWRGLLGDQASRGDGGNHDTAPAFVDLGKGRNAVLYAGEVNWDAAGLEQHKARRIENALSSGQGVLVQVTKDPIGHKGARLTSQVSLPGRYLVYVPDGSMTGISRKLPDTERARLKKILKDIVPENAGVIVRTAAEGASEEELRADVDRLTKDWERIQAKAKSGNAPVLLHGEPDLTVRVVRDVFNEDFTKLVVSGDDAWSMISGSLRAWATSARAATSEIVPM